MKKNSSEAKKLVDVIFKKIKDSKKIDTLIEIEKSEFEDVNRMDIETYPKINFEISKNEIEKLIEIGLLDNFGNISSEITSKKNLTTIEKLLYSLIWKRGDLKKVKHIVQGIKEREENESTKVDGLVFYQFGKYLTKNNNEPIVDQHVLRAFAVYKETNFEEISKHQKMELINKSNMSLISEYKKWLNTEISDSLKKETDSVYYIDKILFALGKTIKNK
jgi:hypothetical protein